MTGRAAIGRALARNRHRSEVRRTEQRLNADPGRPVPDRPGEIRLFAKARNEATRWPWFLEHFRALGVDRFLIVDNGSSDGFAEQAAAEEDVHVFRTDERLDRHPYWFEVLLGRHGRDHWCVAADLDELLVLPGGTDSRPMDLRRMAHALDAEGASALDAVLLDMYPATGVEATGYRPGSNPLTLCDHFDPTITEEPWRPLNERSQRRFDTTRYGGGCRNRVFGVEPNLTKVPFFRHGPATWLAAGAHHLDGNTMSSARAVMLHFKYLHDFASRTHEAVARGGYADGGGTYSAISAALAEEDTIDLRFEGSRQLSDLSQLAELGLLRPAHPSIVSARTA